MEKELASWFHHQYPDLQSAHLNFSSGGLDFGQQTSGPIYMTPHSNGVPVEGKSPYSSFSGLPESKASQPTEHNSWFYCLPQFRQGFAPVLSTVVKEKLAPQSVYNLGEANAGPGFDQKRFLVFDQSGDQTTLIYSSSNGTPVQCLPSWGPKSPPCNLIREGPNIKRNDICPFGENHLSDEYYEEDHIDDVVSEMHEDTEELNALLYSDDDIDYSEDGEEVSTGHSPSTLTAHDLPKWFGETGEEEEASSAWPTKRLKQLDVGPMLMDTAISAKPFTCSDLEDDAESSCGNNDNQVPEASVVSLSGKKRPRKDDIRETISILQTIIPGGEAKDPTVVIDEAISYLRSLKVKAKALGLDTL